MIKKDFLKEKSTLVGVKIVFLLLLYFGYNIGISRENLMLRNVFSILYFGAVVLMVGINLRKLKEEEKAIRLLVFALVCLPLFRSISTFFKPQNTIVCIFGPFSFVSAAVSLLIAVLIYLKYAKRLSFLPFIIDTILLHSVLILLGVSLDFFVKWSAYLELWQNVMTLLYHIFEVITLVLSTVIITSFRDRAISKQCVYVLCSVGISVSIRGLYQFGIFNGGAELVRFLEFLYLIPSGMLFFATESMSLSSRIAFFESKERDLAKIPQNQSKMILAVVLSALAIILFAKDFISGTVLFLILILLLIYYFINHAFQMAVIAEEKLKYEEEKRKQLEDEVERRTRELKQSNLELKEKNELLGELIYFDMNLSLYTIRYLQEYLQAWNQNYDLILMVIDIKEFKNINSQFSYSVGDEVLVQIANRLKEEYGSMAIIFRLNSNRFGLLFLKAFSPKKIKEIVLEIHKLGQKPIIIDDFKIRVNFSIGIAEYEKNAKDVQRILENAEYAERVAHHMITENPYRIFDKEMEQKKEREKTIRQLLENIDFDSEFALHYQPQCDVNGKLLGMEALLRWNSPQLGNIPPSEFIPIAEGSSIILRIAEWTLRKGIAQIKAWNTKYNSNYRVGINISTRFIENTRFLKYVQDTLHEFDIPASWLDLEITETSLMHMNEDIIEMFEKLAKIGVSISIDDFGTGYSSLSYINSFQISNIKIAKELVDGIVNNPKETELVKAIIMMANSLKLEVVAEGVEEHNQLEHLATLGCKRVQGYFFGRPVDPSCFETTYIA